MTDKQYNITGADVLRALADGKKLRGSNWVSKDCVWFDGRDVVWAPGHRYEGTWSGNWQIVEEPATDAELIAEMRKRAATTTNEANWAFEECADMLEQRKVKP